MDAGRVSRIRPLRRTEGVGEAHKSGALGRGKKVEVVGGKGRESEVSVDSSRREGRGTRGDATRLFSFPPHPVRSLMRSRLVVEAVNQSVIASQQRELYGVEQDAQGTRDETKAYSRLLLQLYCRDLRRRNERTLVFG